MTEEIIHGDDEADKGLRRRAERHLQLTRQNVEAMSSREVQELVYELQVHQIELEMQNESLAQAQADSETERQKYQELYDLAPVGYLTLGADDTILDANIMAGWMLGKPHYDLVSLTLSDFLTPDSLDVFFLHRRAVFRTHERQDCQIELTTDPPVHLHVNSHADVGNSRYCRVVLSDITMMKKLEARLLKLSEDAQIANMAKSQFVANMSHELRTPLNAVIGLGSLLKMTKLDERQTQYVDTMTSSGHSLLDLINDLLDFAKLESEAVEFESHPFDLKRLLQDVQRMSAVMANEKGLSLLLEYPATVPEVFAGDSHRIRQIVVNLVSNAIKFTRRGSVIIQVSGELTDNVIFDLTLAVADTGIGIPLEKRGRIFDSFTQADASTTRNYGGTGLGLTISRQLVKLMGGTIAVDANPGGGSIFRVRLSLPVDVVKFNASDGPAGFSVPEQTSGQVSGHLGRVLLVEDQPANVLVACSYLEKLGCEIDVCTSGREAISRCENEHYALILMDIEMPEMDGLETARIIRSMEKSLATKPAAIVALTAHASVDDRQKCLESGMDDYLSKPFDPAKLQQCVRLYVESPSHAG